MSDDKEDETTEHDVARRFADILEEDGEIRGPLEGLFFPGLNVPTLEEALLPLADILPGFAWGSRSVKIALKKAKQIQKQYSFMTLEEIPSIVLYSMEATPRENSLYFVMNKALRNKDRSSVKPWRDFIWLLLHSLKKLPACSIMNVVRGAKVKPEAMNLDLSTGDEFTWAGFSSVTTKVEVLKDFLGAEGDRTMLQITLIEKVARDVRDFSLYPGENELILPPNICLEFVSKLDVGNGFIIIQAVQTETVDPILNLKEKDEGVVAGSGAKAVKMMSSTKSDGELKVRQFLENAGLSSFANTFIENGWAEMDILAEITDNEMKELGLKSGHRKTLLKQMAVLVEGLKTTSVGVVDDETPLAEQKEKRLREKDDIVERADVVLVPRDCATFKEAVNRVATSGDRISTIEIAKGEYDTNVELKTPMRVVGIDGRDNTILKGQVFIRGAAAKDIVIRGVTMTHLDWGASLRVQAGGSVVVEHCRFANSKQNGASVPRVRWCPAKHHTMVIAEFGSMIRAALR